MATHVCKGCGQEFESENPRAVYCHRTIEKHCPICGKIFNTECCSHLTKYCGRYCSCRSVCKTIRTCRSCGSVYTPSSANQKFCNKILETQCVICGRKIYYKCGKLSSKICSQDYCKSEYAKITGSWSRRYF